jgi:hypothetical protein
MMRKVLYTASVLAALDAVTTYVIIAAGRGVEANPLFQFLNDVPEATFLIQTLGVLMLAFLLKKFEKHAAALPAALGARVRGAASAAFSAALAYRAAVVANNVMCIFIGATPLADVLYA